MKGGRWAAALLALSAVLLFTRLGRYALWDDEAGTALTALGILETGDTSARVGRNLFAYNSGAELSGLKLRFMPPLQACLAAPSLALLGRDSALAARLPFALCGLAAVALMLWWLRREDGDATDHAVLASGLLGSAAFFLYARQARYYGPVMLASLGLAYLYARRDGSRRRLAAAGACAAALLGLNYLVCAAVLLALASDYALWGRKRAPLRGGDWAAFLLPLAAAALLLLPVWNPFGKEPVARLHGPWWRLLPLSAWYALRDLHRCELLCLPLLACAPLLWRRSRDPRLLRLPLAALVYVAAVVALAPLPASSLRVAQVRYFTPLIPLTFALAVLCARALPQAARPYAAPLALALLGTNLLRGGALANGPRSSGWDFVLELARPPEDPYAAAAAWVNENVPEGASVWVMPEHATYPLMFHAPKALYAWQLKSPPEPQFAGLAPIHFRGALPPDYLVGFGPYAAPAAARLDQWLGKNGRYGLAAALDVYWRDRQRPELFWHGFAPALDFDREREGVYVYKRAPAERPR